MKCSINDYSVTGGEDKDRLHITIDKTYIIINRTSEGIIIDLYDDDTVELIDTMATDNEMLNQFRKEEGESS